jgi:hypothetical protein
VAHPDFTFQITDKVRVHVNVDREGVILFETHDGKSVQLEASHQTINKIHAEIQKQMDRAYF